jgi:hypothetical protein
MEWMVRGIAMLLVVTGCAGSGTGRSTVTAMTGDSASTVRNSIPTIEPYDTDPVSLHPETLPSPPMQGEPWTPPEGANAYLVEDVRFFFERAGAPDPRGCPRHRVGITVGDVFGHVRAVETVAWVLPRPTSEGRHFVIAPDGLMYLAHAVHERVPDDDLSVLDPDVEDGPSRLRVQRPIVLVFMLRAGVIVPPPEGANPPAEVEREAVLRELRLFVSHWVWTRVERALTAHMRGDDALALHDLELLARLKRHHEWVLIESTEQHGGMLGSGIESALPLLPDQRRRARERQRGTHAVPRPRAENAWSPPTQPTGDPAQLIPTLLRELDQVAERQGGQPGGVDLAADPVVRDLIGLGDEAVEPLLDALEHDDRFTRSVHFFRDFVHHRSVIRVYEAAYVALASILERDFFVVAATGDDLSARGEQRRQALVTAIRTYWQRFGTMPLEERWYATLADDDLDASEWATAGAAITSPIGSDATRASMVRWRFDRAPTDAGLRGEPLRDERTPSVAALLDARLGELSIASDDGCTLAVAALRWGQPGRASERARADCYRMVCECLPDLVTSDPDRDGALTRYARWLRRTDAATVQDKRWALRPAVDNPNHPAVREALTRMRRDPGWRLLFEADSY